MAESKSNDRWQDDEALSNWLSEAKGAYERLEHRGSLRHTLNRPRTGRHALFRPAFALAAGVAVVSLVWFGSMNQIPGADGNSRWEQPADPTSVRDLSSLNRAVRQQLKPAGVSHPVRPQELRFKIPHRPQPPSRSGFAESVETSMLDHVAIRQLG